MGTQLPAQARGPVRWAVSVEDRLALWSHSGRAGSPGPVAVVGSVDWMRRGL